MSAALKQALRLLRAGQKVPDARRPTNETRGVLGMYVEGLVRRATQQMALFHQPTMIEIKFLGRGGQGAVTSAELVALAAINSGKFAQSMPSFGPERRGAPVQAYLRVSDKEIRIRAEITEPDIVVVLDDSLLHLQDVTSGLKTQNPLIVVNTQTAENELRKALCYNGKLAMVDALRIAMETLKVPITNTTMIGALIKANPIVPIGKIVEQIERRFNPKLAERNIAALKRAYEETKISRSNETLCLTKHGRISRQGS